MKNEHLMCLRSGLLHLIYFIILFAAIPLMARRGYNHDIIARITYSLIIACAATITSYFLTAKEHKAFILSTFLLTLLPNISEIAFYAINGGLLKSTDWWVMFDTNMDESKGFFTQYISRNIIIRELIYLAAATSFLSCIWERHCQSKKSIIEAYHFSFSA